MNPEYTNLLRCAQTKCNGTEDCVHFKFMNMAIDMFSQVRQEDKPDLLSIMLEISSSCKRLAKNKRFCKVWKNQYNTLQNHIKNTQTVTFPSTPNFAFSALRAQRHEMKDRGDTLFDRQLNNRVSSSRRTRSGKS